MQGLCIFIFVSLLLSLIACSNPNPTPNASAKTNSTQQTSLSPELMLDTKKLIIATADPSGAYATLGKELAQIYQTQFAIPVSVKTTQGSAENLQLLQDKKADLAFVLSDTLLDAIQGKAEFKQPMSQILQISALYPSYIQIVTPAQSPIQNLADLKGKRIAVNALSARTEANAKYILASAGLKRNDYKMWYFGQAEAIHAFKNAQIDAAFFSGPIPNTVLKQLLADGFAFKLIALQNKEIQQLQKQYPYFMATEIAANSYAQHPAIPTVAIMHALVSRQDLTQHDVYALTQSFFAQLPRLQQAHPAALAINTEQAQQGLVFALHPGAVQYYQQQK